MKGPAFSHVLRSPHSAPHIPDALVLNLRPHPFGGYVLAATMAEGFKTFEGLATAGDLRSLSAKFAAAAHAMGGQL